MGYYRRGTSQFHEMLNPSTIHCSALCENQQDQGNNTFKVAV